MTQKAETHPAQNENETPKRRYSARFIIWDASEDELEEEHLPKHDDNILATSEEEVLEVLEREYGFPAIEAEITAYGDEAIPNKTTPEGNAHA